jgi:hypothetical protein
LGPGVPVPSAGLSLISVSYIKEKEKENWRILTNKEIYAIVKKTYRNRDNEAT